jgi:imidazole glycerol-phosphate synthase subunit HisF
LRKTRLIPVLLIHNGGVYKTNKFKNPIYIGDPINTIRILNDLEVDEIIVLDVDASKGVIGLNLDLIKQMSSEVFVPLAYGGGISSVESAHKVLNIGVEKVVLNHSLLHNPNLISQCVKEIGSQSIVASIDYKKSIFYGNKVYSHVLKKTLPMSLVDMVNDVCKAGVGEVIINCVNNDGVMSGMDLDTIKLISNLTKVPIISCGGVGKMEHIAQAELFGASAIAAGSIFVFHGKHKGILINYPNEKRLSQFLKEKI